MLATQNTAPVTILLSETGFIEVRGYPGVVKTVPRIETLLQLRHDVPGTTFNLQQVSVELITRQEITVPLKFGPNKSQQRYRLFLKEAFRSKRPEKMLGCDIPLRILLPKDISSSGAFPTWKGLTCTELIVNVKVSTLFGVQLISKVFPIAIQRFDNLPLFNDFGPAVDNHPSSDSNVLVELRFNRSSVGPGDLIKLDLNIRKLKLRKRISLKEISYLLWEILECHDAGLPRKKEKQTYISSNKWEENEHPINPELNHLFQKHLSLLRDFLDFHTADLDLSTSYANPDNDPRIIVSQLQNLHNVDVTDECAIPITNTEGLTMKGKLYSVSFQLRTEIRFYGCGSIKFVWPFRVCPFDYKTSVHLLHWIREECEFALKLFQQSQLEKIDKGDYSDAAETMFRFVPPTTIYRDNLQDWISMGYPDYSYRLPDLNDRIGFYVE